MFCPRPLGALAALCGASTQAVSFVLLSLRSARWRVSFRLPRCQALTFEVCGKLSICELLVSNGCSGIGSGPGRTKTSVLRRTKTVSGGGGFFSYFSYSFVQRRHRFPGYCWVYELPRVGHCNLVVGCGPRGENIHSEKSQIESRLTPDKRYRKLATTLCERFSAQALTC